MAEARMSSDALVVARDLYKSFSNSGVQIDILKGIALDLNEGETVAVVGASGIGKSTLLHILGTLDRPDSGTLWYRGRDVFALENAELAKFRNEFVGFVFQFHHLLPEFSALENAMMPGLIKGLGRSETAQAAEAILVRVGLGGRMRHRVGELSGGEQQRVALARALLLKPVILLGDEPTGNLDKRSSEQVHELLIELNREFGMTLVVVTHNMELAALMSRRVTLLDGQLAELDG